MLSIGNKKYRNLQEQVGYNTECIKKIDEYLDGIRVEDKLVVIESDSGTFTNEELVVLSGPLAFISNGSKVWIKVSETDSQFVYKAIDIEASEIGNAYFNVGGSKIVVNRGDGSYNTSFDNIVTIYSNSQIDSIVANIMAVKADKTEVALKANIAGQAFTGAITAPSITETMTGYSFVKSASHGQYFNLSYVGDSKTGNKLTFVLAGTMNFPEVSQVYTIGSFVIPVAIGNKLYPITGSQIAFLSINAQINYVSRVIISGIFNKNSSSNIDVRVNSSGLTANTDYYFRIEQTFLLSDNLAS